MATILDKISGIEAEVCTFRLSVLTSPVLHEFVLCSCFVIILIMFMYMLNLFVCMFLQMARTQKNKATAQHLGLLKARLAKLRRELIAPKGGGGATGDGKSYKVTILYTFVLNYQKQCLKLDNQPTTQQ